MCTIFNLCTIRCEQCTVSTVYSLKLTVYILEYELCTVCKVCTVFTVLTHSFARYIFIIINRPGVAGAVLQSYLCSTILPP